MANGPNEETLVSEAVDTLLREYPPGELAPEEFWGAQFDAGLAWVRFPKGRGGLAVAPRWQLLVDERVAAAGGSTDNHEINVVGIGHAAATLIAHGDPDVHDPMLRPTFTTEDIWCQLYSEPGSGSDLAGLATLAVPDGDEWVVTGQKVWTTLAHRARWGLLLARTNPDAPKHQGITCFVVDMASAGVEVRPLFEMTGEAEFNEVFLDEVRVPDRFRLGEVDHGWSVAMTTLMNERVMAAGGIGPRGGGPIAVAVEAWRTTPDREQRLDELMRAWVDAETLRLTQLRANESAATGTPGAEGSVAKLRWAELNQSITALTMDLLGQQALLYPGGYEFTRPSTSQVNAANPHKAFLRARANSIEGGTSEIMRNILAERILGLPADRADRATPWRDVPRG
jgi:alkylation response protein AidB-like acyl-CoA dehydrogenase